MKWLGYRQIKFTSVRADHAEIRRRSKQAHVTDLAANIREHGDELIHAPTVRMPGNVLLCGRDRMAALLLLKAKRLWVRLCDCTDIEAADLEASENVHRRADSRSDVLARAVRAKEQLLTAQGGTVVPPMQSVKAEARKAVARDAGVSTDAVRKAEQRSAEKAAADDPFAAAAEPEFVPNLKLLGVPIEEGRATCEMASHQQAAIDEADKYLRLAQAALKRLELNTAMQQLYADVHRVASRVRSHRPESICPWCKHIPALVGNCSGCQTMGYVTEEQARNAPRELLDTNFAPVVAVNGAFRLYADALAGNLPKGSAA